MCDWLWWLDNCLDTAKSCGRCGRSRPIADFVFKDKGRERRHSWCRECFAEYKRTWYQRNRAEHVRHVARNRLESTAANQLRVWRHLAQRACVDCGECDPIVLEFDHLRDKLHDVSYMAVSGFSWHTIQAEIEKCVVRCANCHRRKTARERGYFDRKRNSFGERPLVWFAGCSRDNAQWAVSSVDRAPTF